MGVLYAFAAHESRNPHQFCVMKSAEDRASGQAFCKSRERPHTFGFEGAAERLRAEAQCFQANLAVRRGFGRFQAPNLNLRDFPRQSHIRNLA